MMQNLKNWLIAFIAITILGVSFFLIANPAQAVTYYYTWQGNSGYSAQGTFSFDETKNYSAITQNELESLTIAFFDPFNHLIKNYSNIERGKNKRINQFLKFSFNPATQSLVGTFDVGEGNQIGEKDFYLKGNIGSHLELRNLDTNVLDKDAGRLTVEKVEKGSTKVSE